MLSAAYLKTCSRPEVFAAWYPEYISSQLLLVGPAVVTHRRGFFVCTALVPRHGDCAGSECAVTALRSGRRWDGEAVYRRVDARRAGGIARVDHAGNVQGAQAKTGAG